MLSTSCWYYLLHLSCIVSWKYWTLRYVTATIHLSCKALSTFTCIEPVRGIQSYTLRCSLHHSLNFGNIPHSNMHLYLHFCPWSMQIFYLMNIYCIILFFVLIEQPLQKNMSRPRSYIEM